MAEMINCAHRGASGQAPENTIAALKLAIKLGATMAEIDIQQTADDQLVLFHDDKLQRTSDGRGYLWKQTLDQLKSLDVGKWFSPEFAGEKMPTLDEAVEAVRGRLKLNIEMKMHGHERGLEELVARHLQHLDCLDWCFVSSFDWGAVDRLGALIPELKAGYIVGRGLWDDELLDRRVSVLSLEKSLVSQERVHRIHEAGKEVFVWTVDETGLKQQLKEWGVDGVISNFNA